MAYNEAFSSCDTSTCVCVCAKRNSLIGQYTDKRQETGTVVCVRVETGQMFVEAQSNEKNPAGHSVDVVGCANAQKWEHHVTGKFLSEGCAVAQ